MATNIRVYKVIFPNGRIEFESKEKDDRGSCAYGSLESAVASIKYRVKYILSPSPMPFTPPTPTEVTIDFMPFHDVECPSGLSPRRCLPLSNEEQERFWELFNVNE